VGFRLSRVAIVLAFFGTLYVLAAIGDLAGVDSGWSIGALLGWAAGFIAAAAAAQWLFARRRRQANR
jgi:hypothetical protein